MRKRLFLNPAFREAVRKGPLTRPMQARLCGYGNWHTNFTWDLSRKDGIADNSITPRRMETLARLIGFPEDQIWEQ